MGSFAGHVLPGCFFIAFGLWWWCNIMVLIAKAHARFLKSRDSRRPNIEFQVDHETSTWLKVPVPYLGALPLEPFLKVTTTSVGIITELTKGDWSLIDRDDLFGMYVFAHLNNFTHASMYAVFFLAALVEILRFYSLLFLPPSAEHLLSSLAFFVVGELFYFHIHDGRSVLDQNLHFFIYILAFSISFVLLLEAGNRRCFVLFMARTVLIVLLGTWFIQVAHVLYGANPWKDTASNRAFVAIAFTWHILALLFTILCSLLLVSLFTRISCRSCCGRSLAADGNVTLNAAELSSLISENGVED